MNTKAGICARSVYQFKIEKKGFKLKQANIKVSFVEMVIETLCPTHKKYNIF